MFINQETSHPNPHVSHLIVGGSENAQHLAGPTGRTSLERLPSAFQHKPHLMHCPNLSPPRPCGL